MRSHSTGMLLCFNVIAALLSLHAVAQDASQAKDAYTSEGYRLAWSDEFERDGRPDPAMWTYERGLVRNRELQFYRPENARCEKGLLIIEAVREKERDPKLKNAE